MKKNESLKSIIYAINSTKIDAIKEPLQVKYSGEDDKHINSINISIKNGCNIRSIASGEIPRLIKNCKKNITYCTINLSNKNITNADLKEITKVLETHETITNVKIDFSCNFNIGKESFEAIEQIIIKNKKITDLNVNLAETSCNPIQSFGDYEDFSLLGKIVTKSLNFFTERVSRNPSKSSLHKGRKSILIAMEKNNTILNFTLGLKNNNFSEEELNEVDRKISEITERNKENSHQKKLPHLLWCYKNSKLLYQLPPEIMLHEILTYLPFEEGGPRTQTSKNKKNNNNKC